MDFYSCSILIAELMMLALTVHVLRYPGFTRQQKTWYIITFAAIMLSAAGEYIAITYDDRGPGFILPLTIITVIQFSLTPMLPVFFVGALGMHREAKFAGLFFAVNVVFEIISSVNGWIFYFDGNGKYIRGGYYLIYEASYILSVVFLVVCMFFIGRRFKRRDAGTIIMVLVVMAAGILPMLLYKIYSDYLSIAISAFLCYIYYNDLVQQDVKLELIRNQQKVSSMQERIIEGMANFIENRDFETGEHISRTSAYAKALAESARKEGVYADSIDDGFITKMYTLAPMHDIGKIVIPDSILKKPGRLTPEEFEEMKKHASAGGSIVRDVLNGITDEAYISFASDIATYHHEKWDGSGYPEGRRGEDIPLSARIMAFADVFDALVSKRCYKEPVSADKAFEIIEKEAGTHFDPNIARVFAAHKEEFIRIMSGSSDEQHKAVNGAKEAHRAQIKGRR